MSNNDTTKLVATAVGAALSGALLGAAVVKLTAKTPEPRRQSTIVFERPLNEDSEGHLLKPFEHEAKMRRQIAARAMVEEDNLMPRDSVTVRVPATSTNMGPGCK